MKKSAIIITIGTLTLLSACESMQPSKKQIPNSTIEQPSQNEPEVVNLDYKVIYNQSTSSLNSDPHMSVINGAKSGVITDQKTYVNKLKQHTNSNNLPPVDFTQQKIVYQTLGWKSHGGHGIKVKDINDNGSQVSVNLQHILAGCINTQAFEYTSLFVAIDTTKPIKVVMEEVGGCDIQ